MPRVVYPLLRIGIGAGRYDTYAETGDFVRPQQNSELRIWPHATLEDAIGRVKVEHRYRVEMRRTSNGYRNRFRYRFGLAYAFGQARNGQQPSQVSANTEVFFSDREPYFERLRSSITFNYRICPALVAQIGYLHQFDYRLTDETGRDFLMLGLFIELPNGQQAPADRSPVRSVDGAVYVGTVVEGPPHLPTWTGKDHAAEAGRSEDAPHCWRG